MAEDNVFNEQIISVIEHMMEVRCCLCSSCLVQIITFSGAIGLQSNSACLVGHLHLAHMSTSHSHTAGMKLVFSSHMFTGKDAPLKNYKKKKNHIRYFCLNLAKQSAIGEILK